MSEGEKSPEFVLDVSLLEIQRAAKQLHNYCVKNNPGGGEEKYRILMDLNSAAGDVDFKPITKNQAGQVLQKAHDDIIQIQQSGKIDEKSPLFGSLTQLNSTLSATEATFNILPLKKQKEELTRRSFLRLSAIAAVGALLIKKTVDDQNYDDTHIDPVDKRQLEGSSELQQDVEYLKDTYDIDIYTRVSLFLAKSFTGGTLNQSELKRTVQNIRKAASLYPKEYFQNNGIKGISVLKDFKIDGKSFGGDAVVEQGYFVISYSDNGEWQVGACHHEAYHMADLQTNFLESLSGKNTTKTKEWDKVFACNCDPYSEANINPNHFVSDYAETNDVEDRADMAFWIMTPSRHKDLLNKIAHSSDAETKRILTEKMRIIKEDYLAWSNGKMNDQYWEDLLAGKVHEGYFS